MTIATATTSSDAPPPGPLMSQAVVCNGMVYCSGSLGLDPKTGEFVEGTVADRAERALMNLDAVLRANGSTLDKAVKINIFLSSMDHYASVNEVYSRFFTQAPKPCRTCVAVSKLGLDAEVEIDVIAYLG